MTEPACTMHGMAYGHCASCNHASVNGADETLSAPEACSGQICNGVLGMVPHRPDHEIKVSVASESFDSLAPPIVEGNRPVRFSATRSTESVPPLDPLIYRLRI